MEIQSHYVLTTSQSDCKANVADKKNLKRKLKKENATKRKHTKGCFRKERPTYAMKGINTHAKPGTIW